MDLGDITVGTVKKYKWIYFYNLIFQEDQYSCGCAVRVAKVGRTDRSSSVGISQKNRYIEVWLPDIGTVKGSYNFSGFVENLTCAISSLLQIV